MELRIGIDASINSTGFVLMSKQPNGEIIDVDHYMIVPKTKKDPKCSDSAKLITYKRFWPKKTSTYSQTDIYKVMSAENLVDEMVQLIRLKLETNVYDKVSCRIEGSIMSSSFKGMQARVNDLVAFGSVMRYCLIKSNLITEFQIIPPKTLKKLATGNGNAKKEHMISKHQEMFHEMFFDYSKGKIDDIIDAFWLAQVESTKNKIEDQEFNFTKYNKHENEHIVALYSETN